MPLHFKPRIQCAHPQCDCCSDRLHESREHQLVKKRLSLESLFRRSSALSAMTQLGNRNGRDGKLFVSSHRPQGGQRFKRSHPTLFNWDELIGIEN